MRLLVGLVFEEEAPLPLGDTVHATAVFNESGEAWKVVFHLQHKVGKSRRGMATIQFVEPDHPKIAGGDTFPVFRKSQIVATCHVCGEYRGSWNPPPLPTRAGFKKWSRC